MHESFQNNINWNVREEIRKMPKSVQFKIWKQIYENNECNFNEDKDQIKENKLYNSQFQNWFLMQLYLNKVRK